MRLRRKLAMVAAMAVVGAGLTLVSTTTASAAGAGQLIVTGPCGDILRFTERKAPTIVLTITIPSTDPSEVWNLTATQQEYGATTGGRLGNPINLVPNPLPALAFSPIEGGFSTTTNLNDTPGFTLGISYTATKTSPTLETCVNQGFITDPGNGNPGPAAENPAGRPDAPPALTGATEADAGGSDVLIQYDQELLATAQGTPAPSRFQVQVNGVTTAVSTVSVVNDSPPADSVVDLTLGSVLAAGDTVSVRYVQPLIGGQAKLQDLENNPAPSFGPISIPAF